MYGKDFKKHSYNSDVTREWLLTQVRAGEGHLPTPARAGTETAAASGPEGPGVPTGHGPGSSRVRPEASPWSKGRTEPHPSTKPHAALSHVHGNPILWQSYFYDFKMF